MKAPDVEASGVVPAEPADVFAFLGALEHHWAMAGRWIEVVALASDGDGGVVRVRAPLGLRRTFRTQVARSEPPALLEGTAASRAARGRVRWALGASDSGTLVTLSAWVESASALERLALRVGGRWWLRRRFRATIAHLARQFQS